MGRHKVYSFQACTYHPGNCAPSVFRGSGYSCPGLFRPRPHPRSWPVQARPGKGIDARPRPPPSGPGLFRAARRPALARHGPPNRVRMPQDAPKPPEQPFACPTGRKPSWPVPDDKGIITLKSRLAPQQQEAEAMPGPRSLGGFRLNRHQGTLTGFYAKFWYCSLRSNTVCKLFRTALAIQLLTRTLELYIHIS